MSGREHFMSFLLVGGGFVALLLGGESFVRGAVAIARRLGLPPLVIGLTLVGFGTSLPELLTSLQAARAGSPGIAVGNVVGSNTANVLLILGAAALMSPILVERRTFRRDGAILVAASLAALAVVLGGEIGRTVGAVFVVALVVYVAVALMAGRREGAGDDGSDVPDMALPVALAYAAGGLVLVLVGARWLVSGAVDLASALGVSEAVIGVTVVAVGTSLPELVTSVVAARKGESAVAFGNVVGSNIFNVLGILGITAIVAPLTVPAEIAGFDIWVMLGATALLVWAAVSGWRITRAEGAAMIALYAGYIGWIAL